MQTIASTENPTSAVSTRCEPPADVVPRLLSKALTPPVTIRNFFKPLDSTTTTSSSKAKQQPKQTTPADKKPNARQDFFKRTKALEKAQRQEKEEGKKEEVDEACTIEEPELSESQKSATPALSQNEDQEDVVTDENARYEDVMIAGKEDVMASDPLKISEPRGTKRASGEAGSSAGKKRKQDGIQNLFARQMKKQETRSCPICGKEFKATALNVEINNHIDNCLIE